MFKLSSCCRAEVVHGLCMRLMAMGLSSALTRMACSCAVALATLLTGCAGLPTSVERPDSRALSAGTPSRLMTIAAASLPEDDRAANGMRLLPDGGQALEARLALAAAAEHTIDVQYYQIAEDGSGEAFLSSLSDASHHGVRVRLLVDDLQNSGQDGRLMALAAQPNVQVRVFNPLAVRTGGLRTRVLLSLPEFSRINRRMHNKLFVVDNAFAVSGGRNIADEYFGRSQPANFIDMDILTAGPAVAEMSEVFDSYWNSERAFPIESLVRDGGASSPVVANRAPVPSSTPAINARDVATMDDLGQTAVGRQLAEQRIALLPATVTVVADAADKAIASGSVQDGAVMAYQLNLLDSAQGSVLVASPYFVPNRPTMEMFARLGHRAVPVTLITNSLATTDEPLVHSGYARYRSELLATGVGVFELMPEAGVLRDAVAPRGSFGRLHAKLAVVDGRWLSIGSMNMDRRSAHCNTEMGLIVDSPALATQAAQLFHDRHLPHSYRVQEAADRASLRWVAQADPSQTQLDAEPHANWLLQLRLSITSMFVAEDLL